MMIHSLKSSHEHFQNVWAGIKTFEIRKNDRHFKEGDFLVLQEWREEPHDWAIDPLHYNQATWGYSGGIINAKITLISTFAQKKGYVVLGIKVIDKKFLQDNELQRDLQ